MGNTKSVNLAKMTVVKFAALYYNEEQQFFKEEKDEERNSRCFRLRWTV